MFVLLPSEQKKNLTWLIPLSPPWADNDSDRQLIWYEKAFFSFLQIKVCTQFSQPEKKSENASSQPIWQLLPSLSVAKTISEIIHLKCPAKSMPNFLYSPRAANNEILLLLLMITKILRGGLPVWHQLVNQWHEMKRGERAHRYILEAFVTGSTSFSHGFFPP